MQFQDPYKQTPPFCFVDRETGIDAEQSKEKEYPVPSFTTFIQIVPHGSRGEPSEFIAEEFIARKKVECNAGRYDRDWVKDFEHGYSLYKEGKAMPLKGIPLITFLLIAEQRRKELSVRFPTLEALAAVPDSGLGEIGLDGRVLRDLARNAIESRKDFSPVLKELADANETVRAQKEQIDNLAARLAKLESKSRQKAVD